MLKISPMFIIAIIDKWKNRGFLPKDIKEGKSNLLEKSI